MGPVSMYTREHTLSRLCHGGEITHSSHVGTLLCIVLCIQIQINFSAKVLSKIAWAGDYYIPDTKWQSEKSPGWFMVALNGRKTLMNIFFSIKTRRVFPRRLVLSLCLYFSLSFSLSLYLYLSLCEAWFSNRCTLVHFIRITLTAAAIVSLSEA